MTTLNKSTLIGYLGHDAEVRLLPSGESVTSLSLATTETWKDKASGERRESTEWHRIVLYRKLGEIAGQYLRKGMQVYIEGRLQTRKWTDKDGIERYVTEIIADDMKMLGSRPAERESGQPSGEAPTAAASPGSPGSANVAAPDDRARRSSRYAHDDVDDMIPF